MKKSKGWKGKLTKAELKHLRIDAGVTTLTGAKINFEAQAKMRKKDGDDPVCEPCWTCKNIARTLGFPV